MRRVTFYTTWPYSMSENRKENADTATNVQYVKYVVGTLVTPNGWTV